MAAGPSSLERGPAGSAPPGKTALIRELLGGPELCKLFAAVRRRLEESATAKRVTVSGLERHECEALAGLHGWPAIPGPRVQIDIAKLDEALRSSRVQADIRQVLEALGGRLVDRPAQKREQQSQRETLWERAHQHPTVQQRPVLERWLSDLHRQGLVARAARKPGTTEESFLKTVLAVVERLPARNVQLAVLAAEVTGDPHALDWGHSLAAAALRAAARLAGWTELPATAAGRRRLWAEVGVLCDALSAHVLVLGLRPTGPERLARQLRDAARAGEPARISLRELSKARLALAAGQSVFICENPGIVATAADRLGDHVAPLLCTEGIPSTATFMLLDQLLACEVRLRVQCDYDWGGIKIGNMLMRFPAASPWRFSAADYRQAVASLPRGPRLRGAPLAACWDAELTMTMVAEDRAVFEENLLEALLADLSMDPAFRSS